MYLHNTQHHNLHEALVQVTRSKREYMDSFMSVRTCLLTRGPQDTPQLFPNRALHTITYMFTNMTLHSEAPVRTVSEPGVVAASDSSSALNESRSCTDSMPGTLRTRRCVMGPQKSRTTTRRSGTVCATSSLPRELRLLLDTRNESPVSEAASRMLYRSEARPEAKDKSQTPGFA